MPDTHTLAAASTPTSHQYMMVRHRSVSSQRGGSECQEQTSAPLTQHATSPSTGLSVAGDCGPCYQQQASTGQQPNPPSATEAPATHNCKRDTSAVLMCSESSADAPIMSDVCVLRSRQCAWLRTPRFPHAAWDTRGSPLEWSWPYLEPPHQRRQRRQLRTWGPAAVRPMNVNPEP